MSNLIDSVRSYILTCPFLSDGRVNVNYIGTDMGYSVDPLPCDPIMQEIHGRWGKEAVPIRIYKPRRI